MESTNERFLETPAFTVMQRARRWVLRDESNTLYFLDGSRCRGRLERQAEVLSLGTYNEAWNSMRDHFVGVAFALGPDGTGLYWQEIIIADVQKHFPGATTWLPAGYVEICTDGDGIHGIGYGRRFDTLGQNKSGIEAYAEDRFFIFSGSAMRDEALTCLADFTERDVKAYHAEFDVRAGGIPPPPFPNGTKPLPSL